MEEYFCQPHPAQMRGPVELISPDEVRELVVHVEDENGEPLGAEVLVGDRHSFSNIAARPTPPEETSDEQAMARFDLLEDGEYDIEIWTYGHERITDTVTVDGSDRELVDAITHRTRRADRDLLDATRGGPVGRPIARLDRRRDEPDARTRGG